MPHFVPHHRYAKVRSTDLRRSAGFERMGDRVEGRAVLLGDDADGHQASPGIEVQLEERAAAVLDPHTFPLLQQALSVEAARPPVEPPGTANRVAEEPDQERAREVGAEHVLASLALGRGRADLVGRPFLGDAEHRHEDDRADSEDDAENADAGYSPSISTRTDSTPT